MFSYLDFINDYKPSVSVRSSSFAEPYERSVKPGHQTRTCHMSVMSAAYTKGRNVSETWWPNYFQVRVKVLAVNELQFNTSAVFFLLVWRPKGCRIFLLGYLILLSFFRCEHCCHTECLRNEFGDDTNWSCPICSKTNITRRASVSEDRPLGSTRTEVRIKG